MRRRISSDFSWIGILFVIIGVSLVCHIAYTLATSNSLYYKQLVAETILILFCWGGFYLINKAKTVEFDDAFLYLKSKSEEEIIPLENVFKIKLTMTQINRRNMWKIGYFDNNKVERSVKILPTLFNNDFEEFKIKVQSLNKGAEIQNWSSSFDFDQ